jgi:hypothetical protein
MWVPGRLTQLSRSTRSFRYSLIGAPGEVAAGTNSDWYWGMAALQTELPDILLDREVNGR